MMKKFGLALAITLAWQAQICVAQSLQGQRIALVALTSEGKLDFTFGNLGKVITVFPNSKPGAKVGATLDSQRRIVAATTVNTKVGIARYTQDGKLDSTFDGNGVKLTDFGTGHTVSGHAVAVDEYDRIWVAGLGEQLYSWDAPNERRWILARFLPDGSADLSFGSKGDGVIRGFDKMPHEPDALVMSLHDGAIMPLPVPTNDGSSPVDFRYIRFAPDGKFFAYSHTINEAWEEAYKNHIVVSNYVYSSPAAAAVTYTGKVYLGGAESFTGKMYWVAGKWDVKSGDKLDPTFNMFGSGGKITGSYNGLNIDDRVWAMKMDPYDRVVIAGSTKSGSEYRFGLARINSVGTMDITFGNNGSVVTDFGVEAKAFGVTTDSDRILAGGYAIGNGKPERGFAIAKYLPNGSLDNSFGNGGKVMIYAGCSGNSEVHAMLIQHNPILPFGGISLPTTSRVIAVGMAEHDACTY